MQVKGKERQLVKALPEHRIEYVKFRDRVVWHKADRIDLVFGTGNGNEEIGDGSVPIKIDTVIQTYDQWLVAREARNRNVDVYIDLVGVLCEFKSDSYAGLAWRSAGKEIWSAMQLFRPSIFIDVPEETGGSGDSAAEHQRRWCARELGKQVQVIACKAAEKHLTLGNHAEESAEFVESLASGAMASRHTRCETSDEEAEQAVRERGGAEGQLQSGKHKRMPILVAGSLVSREAWEREGGVLVPCTDGTCANDIVTRFPPVSLPSCLFSLLSLSRPASFSACYFSLLSLSLLFLSLLSPSDLETLLRHIYLWSIPSDHPCHSVTLGCA